MLNVFYSQKGTPYVLASDLHDELQVKTPLAMWFPRMIEYGFTEDSDYYQFNKSVKLEQGGNTYKHDWAVQIEMAKHVAMIQRSEKGKEIRNYLLQLDQKVSEGEYLNHGQIMALFDICKVMGYFSIQTYFENEHYDKIFKEPGFNWWEERAKLFGYTAKELQDALRELGVRYKNQRQAIFLLDRLDLIRIGVMDMFLSMGTSKAYAKNVGNIARTIAQEINPEIYNDINASIDFKSEEQNLIITDIKNYKTNSVLLQRFIGGKVTAKPRINPLTNDENQLNLKLGALNKNTNSF
jgi:phage anti-repressor protein